MGQKIKIKNCTNTYKYLETYTYKFIKSYRRGPITYAYLRFWPNGSRIDVNIKNIYKV